MGRKSFLSAGIPAFFNLLFSSTLPFCLLKLSIDEVVPLPVEQTPYWVEEGAV